MGGSGWALSLLTAISLYVQRRQSSFGNDFSPLWEAPLQIPSRRFYNLGLRVQQQALLPRSGGGWGGSDRACPASPFHLGGAPSRVAEATTGTIHHRWECGFSISVRERKLISEYSGSLCCCSVELNNCIHRRGRGRIPTGRPDAPRTAKPGCSRASECLRAV